MAAQIQLANTFNEFRTAYNDAANDISTLQAGNTALNTSINTILSGGSGTGTLYVANTQITELNVTGGRVLVSRAPVSGGGAFIDDDEGMLYDVTTNRLTLAGPIDVNGALRSANVTANNLTSGRVTIAGTSGLLSDDAGLTYDTSTNKLTVDGAVDVNGALRSANVTANNLTSGRVAVVGTSGIITDDAELTYNTSTNVLSVTNVTASAWANAANINATANVNAGDTVNAASHLHVGGVTQWITAKQEDQDIHLITAVAESDGAHDVAIVNRSNSANAYAEFIAINNAGNTDTGWVSLGINATNYNQGAFAVTKGEDAYLLYQAPVGSTKNGDLVIGTGGNGTTNKIIFSANGFDDPANNTQLTIDPGVRVHVEVPTQSVSTTTGALTVAGGIGVVGNMNVGGNVTITGSISLLGAGNTVSTDTLSVANAMLFLANGNSGDSIDIGVIGEYTAGTTKYLGFVRDASDGIFKLFIDASAKPSNTVNFGLAGLNYASAKVGELEASNTTATSSTTTGALRVAGGAGIAGGVWAGGAIRTDSTTPSTSTSSGALIVNGGAGIAGVAVVGGVLYANSTAVSTSTTTGGVVAAGGLGVAGVATIGGVVYANSATVSTSTSTGGVVVAGGLGVSGNTYIGGDLSVAGAILANEIREGVTDVAVSTNTYTCDFNNGSIFYATTAPTSSDFTLNFTNLPSTNGAITTMTLVLPQGVTARRPSSNTIQIGGVSHRVYWPGGNTAITPTASAVDIFTFNILKRSSNPGSAPTATGGGFFSVTGTATANVATGF